MKTNSQIRQEAKNCIQGNWGIMALQELMIIGFAALISLPETISVLSIGSRESISAAYSIFVATPLFLGIYLECMKLIRGEKEQVVFGDVFEIFRRGLYWKVVLLNFLISIFLFLFSLLLIIPGIIKFFAYSMAPFIILDNPDMDVMDAINESIEMMKGHKWKLFLMSLGMIGLIILSCLALGIPVLWLVPFYYMVFALFYENLKNECKQKNSYLKAEE